MKWVGRVDIRDGQFSKHNIESAYVLKIDWRTICLDLSVVYNPCLLIRKAAKKARVETEFENM
jgi:hypothetical protein